MDDGLPAGIRSDYAVECSGIVHQQMPGLMLCEHLNAQPLGLFHHFFHHKGAGPAGTHGLIGGLQIFCPIPGSDQTGHMGKRPHLGQAAPVNQLEFFLTAAERAQPVEHIVQAVHSAAEQCAGIAGLCVGADGINGLLPFIRHSGRRMELCIAAHKGVAQIGAAAHLLCLFQYDDFFPCKLCKAHCCHQTGASGPQHHCVRRQFPPRMQHRDLPFLWVIDPIGWTNLCTFPA